MTYPTPPTIQKLLIGAHILAILTVLAGIQFMLSPTGGTLFVFASIGPGLLGGAIAILGYASYVKFKKAHQLFAQRSYMPDEIIFNQGEVGDRVYFILEGEVEAIRDGKVIATMRDGEYFGEMALVTGERRNATIRTTKATRLNFLGKENFLTMMKTLPQTERNIMATVQERAMRAQA